MWACCAVNARPVCAATCSSKARSRLSRVVRVGAVGAYQGLERRERDRDPVAQRIADAAVERPVTEVFGSDRMRAGQLICDRELRPSVVQRYRRADVADAVLEL